jgi:uroporphyrinogen III methyltransferase/synthase
VHAAGITAPAVTIIGEVVRWRERLRWFDIGPLFGKRILVTRAREQASALSDRLRTLGAEPIEFPTIRIEPPSDGGAALAVALTDLADYDWAVFTSANGVAAVFAGLAAAGRDARAFGNVRIAAIGPATAEALRACGIRADFTPSEFVAEAVAAQFPESVAGKRILLARAAEARDVLPDTWRAAGATVDVVAAYRTELETEGADEIRAALTRGEIDIVTFTSSSTVRNFVAAMDGTPIPSGTVIAAIGPITAETCRELLREPDCIADSYTIEGLVAALGTPQNSA